MEFSLKGVANNILGKFQGSRKSKNRSPTTIFVFYFWFSWSVAIEAFSIRFQIFIIFQSKSSLFQFFKNWSKFLKIKYQIYRFFFSVVTGKGKRFCSFCKKICSIKIIFGVAIAQWIRQRISFCFHGFKSQARHLLYTPNLLYICHYIEKRTKMNKKAGLGL